MKFIELHTRFKDDAVLVNLEGVIEIYPGENGIYITTVDGQQSQFKESYEEVKKLIKRRGQHED